MKIKYVSAMAIIFIYLAFILCGLFYFNSGRLQYEKYITSKVFLHDAEKFSQKTFFFIKLKINEINKNGI